MKLRIDTVHAHGDVNEERVLMTVMEDCDLARYLVMDTTYIGTKISNEHRHVKWLPQITAKKGERVCLYSKKGTTAKQTHDEVIWHKLYWNSGTAVWNNTGDAAVLFEVSEWVTTKAKT